MLLLSVLNDISMGLALSEETRIPGQGTALVTFGEVGVWGVGGGREGLPDYHILQLTSVAML